MWHKGTLTRGLTDRSAPIVSPEISPTNAHPASIGYESRSPLQLTSSSTSALSVAQGCPILNPSEDDIRFQCELRRKVGGQALWVQIWRIVTVIVDTVEARANTEQESQFSTETFHSKDRVQTTRMNGRSKAAETMTQQIDPAVLARTYIQRADDYTVNALNSFSFGNATPSGKVKPRSDSQDDDEGISPTAPVDITPRPSVVHAEAVPTMVSPPKALTNCSSSPPSSSASEAESDSRIANAPSTVRPPHASPGGRGREDIEFSSDDDMFDLDHYDEYSDVEDDGQGDHIEISSARFSVSTESGPPGGFRDREGSVATLKMQRQAPEAADIGMVSELPASVPIFTSPFAAPSIAAVAPNDTSSIGADADFDFAYILGADLSADPSSVPDFVRRASVTSPQNRDQSHFPPPRKDSKSFLFSWLPTFAGRRPSTATVASTNSNANMMFMHDDTFDKELLKWGGDGYREQRKYWTFRRDAHTGSSAGKSQTNSSRDSPGKEGKDETRTRLRNLSNAPRLSTTTLATSAIDASPSNGVVEKELVVESYKEAVHPKEREEKEKERDKDKTKEREKEKDRVRRSTRHWRGMDIGSEEIWNNDLLGSFNVSREEAGNKAPGAASESTKGPQQRLLIRFRPSTSIPAPASPSSPSKAIMFKPTFAEPHLHLPHPPITVHKHSKAMAFSLTRYYRYSPSNAGRGPAAAGHMNMTGSGLPSKTPRPQNPRAPSSRIILLAPRKVQEAFTSTTTTKMLADHGLLGDKEHERDKDRRRKSLGGESSKSKSSVSIAPPDKVRRKRSVASSLEPSSTVIPLFRLYNHLLLDQRL
ncbi:hypothetical protein D9757_008211 [Collybiopsis confluens]|uniref:Uncharacterized protein n=1 Tax=Collybiopsis confluens TaxID=2823264 RepID=A0A8H5HBJ8_9AGAR|nr:hypothetical protein D9757_008211 [Collybiopsis confluens]